MRQTFAAWQTTWNRFVGDISGPVIDALGQVSPEDRRKLIPAREAAERSGAPLGDEK